jgi:protein gp37
MQSTKIQWTDATWNPWHGCIKVSEGCKNCYMYRDKARWNQDPKDVVKSRAQNFDSPLKWKEPKLIFTCSWSDFFIEEADEWRDEAWKIIRETPNHTYQILTKRPERLHQCLPDDWNSGYENVWLGVSAENQQMYDRRVPILLGTPAKTRFISIEPLLDAIALSKNIAGIDWVIIGGESGNLSGKFPYRTCKTSWINGIILDCKKSDVPVFVKQLGTGMAMGYSLKDRNGGKLEEWPESFRVREFPKNYINVQESRRNF